MENEKEHQEYSLKTNEDLRGALQKLPGLIKEKQDAVFKAQTQKGELIKKNKTIESDISRAIAAETEEVTDKKTGELVSKKKYTNDMQRTAQFDVRLMNNIDYNKMQDSVDKLDKWVSETEIELSFLKRLNNNAYALTMLGIKY